MIESTEKMLEQEVIVAVKEGNVRGICQTSKYSKAKFYAFYGIPYGQPPVDELRFKDPVKIKPWNKTYDATIEKPGCIQFSLRKNKIIGIEDCLYTNIYTSKLVCKSESLKPVIVSMHPGGCFFGTPNPDHFGSPEFIMHHNVVYVCIGYRLHILGFLNLKLEECSGNQGIKDIIMALQWIKENISSFGGDPENVTLLGSSSAAALTNLLMLSPAAKSLHHKAVIMGLHLTNPYWPIQDTNEDHACAIAKALGYQEDPNDNKKLLLFIKKQKLEDLIEEQLKYQRILHMNMGMFLPSLDRGMVLPESPRVLNKSVSKIPIMVGFCERESILGFTNRMRPHTEKNFKRLFCQNQWSWGYGRSDEEIETINEKVESFYTNGQPIEKASFSLKVDIQTDIWLSCLYDTLIDVVAAEAPVFMYKFKFEGENFSLKTVMSKQMDEELDGTFHNTDFSYWNCFQEINDKPTQQMVETFTKLVVTFATTGNPNYTNLPVSWEPTKPDKPCYLSINNELEMIDGKLNHKRSEFWDEIVKQFNH